MPRPEDISETRVIGVDCATDPKKVGLALGVIAEGRTELRAVTICNTWSSIDERIASWVGPRTLLALDAPLGWPASLGVALHDHQAGQGFVHSPNAMFRRATDDAIAQRLGKRPLDVGGDRIARTAHTALALLDRLRERLDAQIHLVWQPGAIDGIGAIEVYPGGTLAARSLPSSGYKGPSDAAVVLRRDLVKAAAKQLAFDAQAAEAMTHSDHVLDAALCVCAGLDFLAGNAVPPDDLILAKREGWIWVCERE